MSNRMGPSARPGTAPGRMTAVMRAVTRTTESATGPKLLRVGVVSGGRIVEERIVRRGAAVSVGPSERSTIVIGSATADVVLFEPAGDGAYTLRVQRGMSGRIAQGDGIVDLADTASLAARARPSADGAYALALGPDARGKIVLDETTLLFQLVAPPPPQPKPQLPLAVKAGAEVDWRLVIVGAFTFLAHFAPVLFLFSDWNDRAIVADTGATVSVIDPSCERVADQTVREACPLKPAALSQAQPEETTSVEEQPQTPSRTEPSPRRMTPSVMPASPAPDKGQAAADSAQTLLLQKLMAMGGGPGSELARGDRGVAAPVNVTAIADQTDGTAPRTALDRGSPGNGVVVPGGDPSLVHIGTHDTDETHVTDRTNAQHTVVGTLAGTGVVNPGHLVGDPEPVIRGPLAGAAKACYERELPNKPDLRGTVSLLIIVGPSGEPASVSASGLDPAVDACISAAARRLNYGAVKGGGTAPVSATFAFLPRP